MEYNKILARSFSHSERKKIGYWAIGACLVVTLLTSFALISKPSYLATSLPIHTSSSSPHISSMRPEIKLTPVCNVLDPRFDICEIDGHIRVHGKSSTVLYSTSSARGISSTRNESWRIKPYARKPDNSAMAVVNEILVKPLLVNDLNQPNCSTYHTVLAVIFSVGGYAGNHYHAYTDILVPLFLTSHRFNQQVQFLVTNFNPYWISKYKPILNHLSKYPILDIDKENDVHCYPSVIVGLEFHKDLTIDPLKSPKHPYSMTNFTRFLRNTYSLKRSSPLKMRGHSKKPPRLLIVSRKRTRKFTNEDEIAKMARSLGYEVIVEEPGVTKNATRFAQMVNSCDVMMGVHGAGLTNMVLLPPNAVFIQIVPWGGLEWVCRVTFEEPAKDMKLKYLEYKITENESSLIQQYPLDHADPGSIRKQGWHALRSVFLDNQDVNIDVERFRPTLLKALELLHV
ncbi:hypothetical protein MKW94_023955 [Papaver nudicaule]|uniref:Glycosyltransferase 61 catalytic domain-containing protein n=1 Tax=Papaver nudicaule TaxID=74823 RepID=A0AA41UW54_PAPNU|nr:hypothetical protein [Papaver nudicaule]MCL7022275.1 hypothetical protein [Papaver nudicaule]